MKIIEKLKLYGHEPIKIVPYLNILSSTFEEKIHPDKPRIVEILKGEINFHNKSSYNDSYTFTGNGFYLTVHQFPDKNTIIISELIEENWMKRSSYLNFHISG